MPSSPRSWGGRLLGWRLRLGVEFLPAFGPLDPGESETVTFAVTVPAGIRHDRLAEAADISASYGRALLAEFQADPTLTASQGNGQRPGVEVGER